MKGDSLSLRRDVANLLQGDAKKSNSGDGSTERPRITVQKRPGWRRVSKRSVNAHKTGDITMKNMVLIAGLASTMTLGGLSAVEAANHKGGMKHGGMQMQHSFEELDTDGDGKITPEEMAGHMQARFEGADSDGDGALSRDELIARMMERRAERMGRYADHMIERHDADADGKLSVDEMRGNHQGKMLERLDTDGDGSVSEDEFAAMQERRGDKNMRGRMQQHDGMQSQDSDRGMRHGAHHGKGDGKPDGHGHHGHGHHGQVKEIHYHYHYYNN
jgi:Ca2+-binding EF-hand superfamily protein